MQPQMRSIHSEWLHSLTLFLKGTQAKESDGSSVLLKALKDWNKDQHLHNDRRAVGRKRENMAHKSVISNVFSVAFGWDRLSGQFGIHEGDED
jgi:hypothetical protein